MITHILTAVDDSAPALEAADFAIELASALGAHLDVVHVADGGVEPPIVGHVVARAGARGVDAASIVTGDGARAFEAVLAAASRCGADLIVMGRTDKRSIGRPYVGSQTEHLLEFTELPVVVVPERIGRRGAPE